MTKKIFALVDCNNFYVSCERVFNANLENKPVAVLSNNDGCFIARSSEVKALGIPMGAPVYKWQDAIKKNKITLFSANFPLYGDMSHRVMKTLEEMCPSLERYSIDEAFLDLTNMRIDDIAAYAKKIRETVLQWTGIPVSVGIGSTRTLAKAANNLAKKNPETNGVFNFLDYSDPDIYLAKIPVKNVWGVGWQYAKLLERFNINSAKDLKYADAHFIKTRMSVVGERTQLELTGTACIEVSKNHQSKKAIAVTRTFDKYRETYQELSESIAYFTRKVGEKLRSQASVANYLQLFLVTNFHRKDHKQYHNSVMIKLAKPSDFSPLLITSALQGLAKIYRPGFLYKRAGVSAFALQPKGHIQYSLLEVDSDKQTKSESKLMHTVDTINRRVGDDTLKYAAEGKELGWWRRQAYKSPRYTTKWSEILEVKCLTSF